MLREITDDEFAVVLEHRLRLLTLKKTLDDQKNCEHHFHDYGNLYGNRYFECLKCKETKWE